LWKLLISIENGFVKAQAKAFWLWKNLRKTSVKNLENRFVITNGIQPRLWLWETPKLFHEGTLGWV